MCERCGRARGVASDPGDWGMGERRRESRWRFIPTGIMGVRRGEDFVNQLTEGITAGTMVGLVTMEALRGAGSVEREPEEDE